MYIGHAAIALAIRARRPDVPILALTLASYGPDWIETVLMMPHPRSGVAPLTHSIPAIVIGATLAAVLYRAFVPGRGALMVALAWLSHWPLDLVTGLKPIIGLSPLIGLDVYHIPLLDFVIEALVVSVACLDYAHAMAWNRRQRFIVTSLWGALLAAQGLCDYAISRTDPREWAPSLAKNGRRPHVRHRELADHHPDVVPHGSCINAVLSSGVSHEPERAEGRCHAGMSDLRQGTILHA